jgi:hypothetical protein
LQINTLQRYEDDFSRSGSDKTNFSHYTTKPKNPKYQEAERKPAFFDDLAFDLKDVKLLQKVKKARPNFPLMMIISRTGQQNENGFPCHECLKIILNNPAIGKNKDDIYFSTKTQGRCDKCISLKTSTEWNTIAWERLEWYNCTADGQNCANQYEKLASVTSSCVGSNKVKKTCASNSKVIKNIVLDKIVSLVSTEISQRFINENMDELLKGVIEEVSLKIYPSILETIYETS